MTEMKRPWDFWKAFLCAQTVITVLYIFYGTLLSLLSWGEAHITKGYSSTPTKASLLCLSLTKGFRCTISKQPRTAWVLCLP